jgi:hypothetical protein
MFVFYSTSNHIYYVHYFTFWTLQASYCILLTLHNTKQPLCLEGFTCNTSLRISFVKADRDDGMQDSAKVVFPFADVDVTLYLARCRLPIATTAWFLQYTPPEVCFQTVVQIRSAIVHSRS